MQACDYCARAKRACNKGQPCETCQLSKAECTYSRPGYDPSEREYQNALAPLLKHEPLIESEISLPDVPNSDYRSSSNDSGSTRMRVEFLLNFTKPGHENLSDYFAASTSEQVSVAPSPTRDDFAAASFAANFMDLEGIDPGSTFSDLADFMWTDVSSPESFHLSVDHEMLQFRANELVSEMSKSYQLLTGKDDSTSAYLQSNLALLFTTDHMVEFTKLYFQNWHPNCNILHPASFSIENVSLSVLLAVCLIGATYTSPRAPAALASLFFDAAEKFIFEQPGFKRLVEADRSTVNPQSESIEAIQAAFLMVSLQNWRSSTAARRRMRTRHYSDIISATRCLRLPSAKNETLSAESLNSKPFDWYEYIEAESRVRFVLPFWPQHQGLTFKAHFLDIPCGLSIYNFFPIPP
jgi:hypothetical protein